MSRPTEHGCMVNCLELEPNSTVIVTGVKECKEIREMSQLVTQQ